MTFLMNLVTDSLVRVWVTLTHNWYLLILSVLIATAMKLYVDQKKVAAFLQRYKGAGVVGATVVAVTTPLCSCGTTAIILGMMASMISWAPIVAFMVSSPLSSPQGMFYTAGIFGWPFAIAMFVSSILLGLLGGWVAHLAEKRGWLADQARYRPIMGGSGEAAPAGALPATPAAPRVTLSDFVREFIQIGSRLLAMFVGFAFIGYVLNGLIPQQWVTSLFGGGRIYGVPLAATLGLPLYINSEASLPLVRGLMESGMSQGATLAFLITGAGTSIGAITGALTIARWRVVGLVIATLWVGATIAGFAFNALLAAGLF